MYDAVFGGDFGEQLDGLYPKCVAPLLDGLFKGYNATVFAYGAPQQLAMHANLLIRCCSSSTRSSCSRIAAAHCL